MTAPRLGAARGACTSHASLVVAGVAGATRRTRHSFPMVTQPRHKAPTAGHTRCDLGCTQSSCRGANLS